MLVLHLQISDAQLLNGSTSTMMSTACSQPPPMDSSVELGCEEIILESDEEIESSLPQAAPPTDTPQIPHCHLDNQFPPGAEEHAGLLFSPDDGYGLQPNANLINAALISPGEVLQPSSIVSAPPPEMSPELLKVNFPHITVLTGFYSDALPPLSPAFGGEGIPGYLTDSPYMQ